MRDSTHSMQIRVRYAEAGRSDRVAASRIAVFLETGRTEMLRAAGLNYHDLETAGALLVVSRLSITCRAPIGYDDLLTIETRLTRATSARIDHAYRLLRDGHLVAEGRTTLGCVTADGRMQRMPDALLELLSIT